MTAVRHRLGERPGLQTLYQPVWDLQGEPHLFGVEALTRGPEDGDLYSADDLFGGVQDLDDLAWLDWQALEAAVVRLPRLGLDCQPHLLLNVNASTVELDGAFPERLLGLLDEHRLEPSRVLLEVIEKEGIRHPAALGRAVHLLRDRGLEIALDDIGQGNANHRMILALRPEYLKLDRFLVRGVAFDGARRALVASFVLFARLTGCRIIAEGIETEAQLEVLRQLGVPLGQGYLLGRPRPAEQLSLCAAAGGLCTARGPGCPTGPQIAEVDLFLPPSNGAGG